MSETVHEPGYVLDRETHAKLVEERRDWRTNSTHLEASYDEVEQVLNGFLEGFADSIGLEKVSLESVRSPDRDDYPVDQYDLHMKLDSLEVPGAAIDYNVLVLDDVTEAEEIYGPKRRHRYSMSPEVMTELDPESELLSEGEISRSKGWIEVVYLD